MTFQDIYDKNVWGGSGPGSDPSACGPYLEWLKNFISEHHVESVFDVGCGDLRLYRDFEWCCVYRGVDLVDARVDKSLPFICGDANNFSRVGEWDSTDWDSDLILIKDVLQHLPHREIRRLLGNVQSSTFVAITNDRGHSDRDIEVGQYRAFDLNRYGVEAIHSFEFKSVPRIKKTSLFHGSEIIRFAA